MFCELSLKHFTVFSETSEIYKHFKTYLTIEVWDLVSDLFRVLEKRQRCDFKENINEPFPLFCEFNWFEVTVPVK